MTISIIVTVSDNSVIGKDGKIPWKLSTDLARVDEITTNKYVVMGRKTFESIGESLENRVNVVLSKSYDPVDREGNLVRYTFDGFMRAYNEGGLEIEHFIIGGQQIYDEIFKTPELIHRVYLTRVHCNVEGDTFFHYLFDRSVLWPVGEKYIKWHLVESTFIPKSDKDEYDSTFQVWENRS